LLKFKLSIFVFGFQHVKRLFEQLLFGTVRAKCLDDLAALFVFNLKRWVKLTSSVIPSQVLVSLNQILAVLRSHFLTGDARKE
jgi:hypothetical protein